MAGTIEKRGQNSYRLTVTAGYDGNGQQIRYRKTVTASSRQAAERLLATFVAEVEQGVAATTGTAKMTMKDFFDFWLDHTQHKINTRVYYERLWPRIETAFGRLRLQKIEPRHILAFMKNLAEPGIRADGGYLSPNTQRKYYAMLKTMFSAARKWRFITYNPCDSVEPPRQVHQIKPIYDEEKTAAFLQALSVESLKWQSMVLIALAAGLRREELFGLEWQDVDFTASAITIRQASVYAGKKYGVINDTPKTAASVRTITVPENVLNVLRQYKTEQNEARLKLGNLWKGSTKVWTTPDGGPAHPTSFTSFMRKFTLKNDLPPISPHSLRHMTATFLIRGGVDLRTVSGKLGHADGRVTMQVYAHLLKSAEKETADFMGQMIEAAQTKSIQKSQKTAQP